MTAMPASAWAREGWDCTYEGAGDAPARYVSHFARHGGELVEPHWPNALTYRILVETSSVLIAAHANAEPPSYRHDTRGFAAVLMIDKMTGRMRRSEGGSRDATDHIEFGTCERL
jgi:hypothetical protein